MDRIEKYDLPEHHAVSILAKEVVRLERAISRTQSEIDTINKDGHPYHYITRSVDRIKEYERQIEECQDAIKWIYGQIV